MIIVFILHLKSKKMLAYLKDMEIFCSLLEGSWLIIYIYFYIAHSIDFYEWREACPFFLFQLPTGNSVH